MLLGHKSGAGPVLFFRTLKQQVWITSVKLLLNEFRTNVWSLNILHGHIMLPPWTIWFMNAECNTSPRMGGWHTDHCHWHLALGPKFEEHAEDNGISIVICNLLCGAQKKMGKNGGKPPLGWNDCRPLQEFSRKLTFLLLCKEQPAKRQDKNGTRGSNQEDSEHITRQTSRSFLLPLPDDTLSKTHTKQNAISCTREPHTHKLIRT